jgi:hydroxypyruvate reductase
MEIFQAGLDAVKPEAAIGKYCRLEGSKLFIDRAPCDLSGIRNLYIIGAGKAAASMASALESILGDRIAGGVVTVKYGHLAKLSRVKIIEAGHPVPDENGLRGAEAILETASRAGKGDLVICLISGGASALLPLPARGLSLEDEQETARVLISCGASIHEINTVRKHISAIKGGRLAQAADPAAIVSLILSDVVGDNLDIIGSGPTVADPDTFADCLGIFEKYRIRERLPKSVVRHIEEGASGSIPETPKPGDPVFEKTRNVIIGNNRNAILAAQDKARAMGYHTLILSSMMEGETRHVARVHGAVAREILASGNPVPSPACILSGGETTVTITGKGLGGRNQEFCLAVCRDIAGLENAAILSAGTDGTDGPTDAAGAIVDSTTLSRAEGLGLDPQKYLADNDAYHFFEPLGDLIVTGPTNTNVMDLRIVLVNA